MPLAAAARPFFSSLLIWSASSAHPPVTPDSTGGRPSIPPEHLLKARLLIALYSIRSERQFCERLRCDLLFKWFLDLNISDAPFDASTFSKNRERLLAADVAHAFFAEVVAEARRRRLLSAEPQRRPWGRSGAHDHEAGSAQAASSLPMPLAAAARPFFSSLLVSRVRNALWISGKVVKDLARGFVRDEAPPVLVPVAPKPPVSEPGPRGCGAIVCSICNSGH